VFLVIARDKSLYPVSVSHAMKMNGLVGYKGGGSAPCGLADRNDPQETRM
jgi:hypothetical protein